MASHHGWYYKGTYVSFISIFPKVAVLVKKISMLCVCDDVGCDKLVTCTFTINYTYMSQCGATKNVTRRKMGVDILVYLLWIK